MNLESDASMNQNIAFVDADADLDAGPSNELRQTFLLTKFAPEQIESMPVLARFYGIVVRIVFIRSFAAHFHAIYGQCELVVAISPLRIMQGDAPRRVCDMVLEWAGQHQKE